MRHGSLFSGIGGFDLASEWMGWENVFHCEWNEFGQKVLKYYWPKAITYNDITKTDFSIHRGSIDIITGGFPCQPYSMAGKRLGKEDERHLWPEMLRAIREVRPTWVVGENVFGLVNWNGGMVFEEVQTDLEAEGYEVQAFILPAASVNAPHKRERIFIIAYSKSQSSWGELQQRQRQGKFRGCNSKEYATNSKLEGLQGCTESREIPSKEGKMGEERNKLATEFTSIFNQSNVANSNGIGLRGQSNRFGKSKFFGKNSENGKWENFPISAPICSGNDGIFDRLDGITFSKWRNESIKAGGNAIVPQVVYQIFKAIDQYNNLNK